ncbi:hypothetical protein T484DRAFT_1894870 [Baffinella frigidus]|nr:hypothetical protein T484DRAFT_1894870 [Cryptophyta sp. CCMP2293]
MITSPWRDRDQMVSSGAPAQGSAAAKRELRFVKRKDCARGSPDKGQENAAENTRALDLRRVALLLLLSPALLLFLFNPFALFFYFLFGLLSARVTGHADAEANCPRSGVFWLSFLPKALFFLLLEAAILQALFFLLLEAAILQVSSLQSNP